MMELGIDYPFSKQLEAAALRLIQEQWHKDLAALASYKEVLSAANETGDQSNNIERLKKQGTNIGLLAKWLPREGESSEKKLGFVDRFATIYTLP